MPTNKLTLDPATSVEFEHHPGLQSSSLIIEQGFGIDYKCIIIDFAALQSLSKFLTEILNVSRN